MESGIKGVCSVHLCVIYDIMMHMPINQSDCLIYQWTKDDLYPLPSMCNKIRQFLLCNYCNEINTKVVFSVD